MCVHTNIHTYTHAYMYVYTHTFAYIEGAGLTFSDKSSSKKILNRIFNNKIECMENMNDKDAS